MAYAKKTKFTIQNGQVGGTSGSITDYPVLILGTFAGAGDDPDLRTTGNGGDIQNTDSSGGASGGVTVPADLAFYDDFSGTTQYDHEVVSYTASSGQFEAWVRIPTLNKGSDTVFYMHHSDSGVTTSQENVGGVWEANYKGVWHLGESSGTRYDSSGNSNDLTDNNTVPSGTGIVGTGIEPDAASSEFLSISDGSQTGLDLAGDLSIGFWVNQDSSAGAQFPVSKYSGTGNQRAYQVQLAPDGDMALNLSSDGTTNAGEFLAFRSDDPQLTNSTWFHILMTFDISAETASFYVDGSSVANSVVSGSGLGASLKNSTADFLLAAQNTAAAPNSYLDGFLDEVFVYDGILDSEYVTTVYNNQNSPSTFYTISTTSATTSPNVSDTVTLSEEITATVDNPGVSVEDTATLSEEVSASVSDPQTNVSDTVTISEEVSVNINAVGTFSVAITETITVSEDISVSITGPDDLEVSVTETVTTSEEIGGLGSDPQISTEDTVTLSEEVSLFKEDPSNTFNLSVQDTVTITEEITISGAGHSSNSWRNTTDLSGSIWTTDNDYNKDD